MITSKQNDFIKRVRSFKDKKNRDAFGEYIVEGVKSVKEAIERATVVAVITVPAYENGVMFSGGKTETVSEEVFKSVSEEISPQGVLAVVKKPESRPLCGGNCVLLDGVSDPANVGAIIRTAAAAGYNDVLLTEDCADPFSPKAVRASMGGIFRVNIVRGERENLVKSLKIPFVVADMRGENVFGFKPKAPFCLCIGNEGNGVSDAIKKRADFTVSIPMENNVESLNAAVSAGILMYNLKN